METTFGELVIGPAAGYTSSADPEGATLQLVPFEPGQRCVIGPDPGYAIVSPSRWWMTMAESADLGHAVVVTSAEPLKICHCYYGEDAVPAGTWQIQWGRRQMATA